MKLPVPVPALILSLLSVAMYMACSKTSADLTGNDQEFPGVFKGRLVDKNGDGISGVRITSVPGGCATVSEDGGTFACPGLPAGIYKFYLEKADYVEAFTQEYEFNLSDTITMASDFPLVYRWATINGIINDNTGAALLGAGIVVEDQGVSTTSYSEGRFTLQRVDPGDVTLYYSAAGGVLTGTHSISTQPDTDYQDVTIITDETGGAIGGKVTGALYKISADNSLPRMDFTVSAVAGVVNTTTDALGRFTLEGIPSGVRVQLRITTPDSLDMFIGGVTVNESEITTLTDIIFEGVRAELGIQIFAEDVFTQEGQTSVPVIVHVVDAGVPVAGFDWDLTGDGTFDTTTVLEKIIVPKQSAGEQTIIVRAFDADSSFSENVEITILHEPLCSITPEELAILDSLGIGNPCDMIGLSTKGLTAR